MEEKNSKKKERKMRDSGIPWIGEVPEKWKVMKIGHCFRLKNEKNFLPENKVQLLSLYTGIGVFPTNSEKAKTSGNHAQTVNGYKIVHKNDIVVNIILAWMGSIGVSDYDGVVSPAYDVYTPDLSKVIPRYAHYVFRTDGIAGECLKYGRGIMMMRWRTYSPEFKQIKIPFPSLKEQHRIADFLDSKCSEIDALIENLRARMESVKEYKKAVITEAVTKGLNKDAKMKDAGVEWIGEITEGWKVAKAKYCIEIQNGSDPHLEGNIPVYGSGAKSFKTCGEYKNGPTVLIGRKGATLHIPHYIVGKFWNVDTAFNVYTKPHYLLKYYYYCAVSFDYKSYISQTTLPSMTQTNYENMVLPMPSMLEQQQIVSFLDSKCSEIDALLQNYDEQITVLEEYKKSLIYEYVTGKKILTSNHI